MQQFITQNQTLIVSVVSYLVLTGLSALFQRLPTNNIIVQILRAVLQSGKSLDNHVAEKADTITPQTDGTRVVKLTLAGLTLLACATACGGSLHSTIETVMVFQAEVHTEQAQVLLAANAAIATLPADQQQAALGALNAANDKLTAALNAKDAALQAALDASDTSGINIQQIESDILAAVNAVVALVQTFGVAEQSQRAQASATRLLAARTPVVRK